MARAIAELQERRQARTSVAVIAAGEADVVLAIGQESMSLAPHVAPLRAGVKTFTLGGSTEHDYVFTQRL